jgi:uncharacterized protein (DUF934 family)
MPTLVRWDGVAARAAADPFTFVADDEAIPTGDVIVSLARFHAEGAALTDEGRRVGVRVAAGEAVESLAYDPPAIAVVALEFPKFKDGRAYSAARILRDRCGYEGEIRAVGDVLLEQARFMIRCGFTAFEPADGASPDAWTAAAHRFRYVYQRAADAREPAWVERDPAAPSSLPLMGRVDRAQGETGGVGAPPPPALRATSPIKGEEADRSRALERRRA